MTTSDPVVLTQIVGFGVFLWLGLYLLVRTQRRSMLIIAALIALLAQSIFFGTSALTYTTTSITQLALLERWFWWTAVIPIAAWFHFSSLLVRSMIAAEERSSVRPIARSDLIVYTVAGVITVLGTSTTLYLRFDDPVGQVGDYQYIGPGSLYVTYIIFLVVVASGAMFNLLRALRSLQKQQSAEHQVLIQQLRLLVGGALLFLAGGIWISMRYNANFNLLVLPGYLCLLFGLAGVGYGIAQFGLLLEGQRIQRDFAYNLTGITLLNLVYAGVLLLTSRLSIYAVLGLVALVTLTHTTFDSGRWVWDKLFFSQAEQTARAEARDYASVLATTPVQPPTMIVEDDPPADATDDTETVADEVVPELASEKAFKNAVRRALTGLKNPPQLAKNPLLTLRLVEDQVKQAGQPDNRLNRVTALREILIDQIDGLRPKDDSSLPTGDAWRFYNVLYYPYVRELSRKGALFEARRLEKERQRTGQRDPGELEQVLSWLADVDEDTFYMRHLKKQIETGKSILRDTICTGYLIMCYRLGSIFIQPVSSSGLLPSYPGAGGYNTGG